MSKLKRAAVASVFALGVTAATITPASAGAGTYSCGASGPLTGWFSRTAPTTIQLVATVFYTSPTPIPKGKFVATLGGPSSPPYPVILSNPNALPPTGSSVTLTGPAPALPLLPAAPATIDLVISPPGLPVTTIACVFVSQAPVWPV